MTSFQSPDSTVWYQITNSVQGFNSSLQFNGFVIWLSGSDPPINQLWQFFPSNDGSYQIRNKAITEQLTGCYKAGEPTAGHTQPCMMPTTNDTTQEWKLSQWPDGTYKIINVANGTGYNMDCHPGNSIFMSPDVAETLNQPGQHWEIKSLSDNTDGAFSSAFPAAITTTTPSSSPAPASATSTGTSTTSISLSSSKSNPPTISSTTPPLQSQLPTTRGLSTAAAAGIDVSIGVLVCFLAALAFFLYRRRKQIHQNTISVSELHSNNGFRGGLRIGLQEAPHADPSEMYSLPAELPVVLKPGHLEEGPSPSFQTHYSLNRH